MFSLIPVTLLMGALLIKSEDIILKVNSTNVFEGMPVELSCEFIDISHVQMLLWENIHGKLNTKLTCDKMNKCTEYNGYQLSRIGDKITLVIKNADVLNYKWECANQLKSFTKIANLNITANPKLDLKINKGDSHYHIITSCSTLPMNVSCMFNKESLQVTDLQKKKCSIPDLSYLTGIIKSAFQGRITCTVHQNDETSTESFEINQKGITIVIGVIIGIVILAICVVLSCIIFKLGYCQSLSRLNLSLSGHSENDALGTTAGQEPLEPNQLNVNKESKDSLSGHLENDALVTPAGQEPLATTGLMCSNK